MIVDADSACTRARVAAIAVAGRRRGRLPMPLLNFVEAHSAESLGFIATDAAWHEIRDAFAVPLDEGRRERLTFRDPEAFTAALARLCSAGSTLAVVVSCTENDATGRFGNMREVVDALLACGKPFYAAMGDTSDIHLIDKYADECFARPGAFGHKLRCAVLHAERFEELRDGLTELSEKGAELSRLVEANAALRLELAARSASASCPAEPNAAALRRALRCPTVPIWIGLVIALMWALKCVTQ